MKSAMKWVFTGVIASIGLFLITSIPFIMSTIRDNGILDKEIQVKDIPIEVEVHGKETDLSLDEKINMAWGNNNIEKVGLKMGRLFSLYEARKVCHDELTKMLSGLEEFVPTKENIDLTPELFIDTDMPSDTMVIWRGLIKIDKDIYQIMLEEESEKIVFIQSIGGSSEDKKVMVSWKEYIYKS